MKKMLKWFLVLAGGFALLLLALVVILPRVFDPNEQKERLESLVTEATGRSFEIQGEIQWSLFPSLGFSAGPLLLGNAEGFESAQFARIGNVQVSIQLPPLFDGRFEVDEVSVSDLQLDLEVNEDGMDNWQSLMQGGSSSATDGAEPNDSAGLRIEGITLSNGVIRYTDRLAGMAARATELSFQTSTLALGQSLEASLAVSLHSEYWPGPMVVDLVVSVDDPLAAESGSLQVQTLTINGTVVERLPLDFQLLKPFDVAPDLAAMQIEQWKLTVGPAEIRGNLQIASNDGLAPVVSGRVDVQPFDARQLLTALNGSALQLADPEALARVAVGANWQFAGDTARLSDLEIRLDDTTINGQFELSSIANLVGVARLDIDQIDLDRYMAASSEPEPESEPGASTGEMSLPSSQLTAELNVGQVTVAGLKAENVSFSFQSEGAGFKLYPLKADLYQGHMVGSIELPKGLAGELQIRNSLTNINAAPLLADLLGQAPISGVGDLEIDLTFNTPSAANVLKSANGTLEFRFADGAVQGVDVMGIMRQAAQLLGSGSEEFRNQGQDPATDFSSLLISAVIRNGVLTTSKMTLQSPYLRVTGNGSIDLAENTLDYIVEPVLVSTPTGQGGLGLEKLEGIAIPVTLSGTFEQPEWRIDPVKLLLASQRGKLGESTSQLLESIGGTGKDDDEEEADLGQNLFNAFLNEASKREQRKKEAKPDNH